MAEYSLYFGTHSAHKANAWILRLWLNHEFAFLKQKDYHHSFFSSSFFLRKQSKTHKTKTCWNYELLCEGFEQQP